LGRINGKVKKMYGDVKTEEKGKGYLTFFEATEKEN
jgi:hypothetical protein